LILRRERSGVFQRLIANGRKEECVMGVSARTLSFRNATQADVIDAYRLHTPTRRAFLAPEKQGWVVAFEEAWYGDVSAVPEISLLCHRICRSGLILVIDLSTILSYCIYDSSGVVADYSRPADPCNPSESECRGLAGRPETLESLGAGSVSAGSVRKMLKQASTIDDAYWRLLDILNIPFGGLMYEDFTCHFEDIGFDDWAEWPDFVHVGGADPVR
jgi:hypothetical protein